MENIAKSLNNLHQRILQAERDYARKPDSVRLLAVSKTRPIKDIVTAIDYGQLDYGENYVQEAVDKIKKINYSRLIWHFIGPIQSNKTQAIAEHFHWVHTLDREKIARRLDSQRPTDLPPLNVCIQVNIDAEQSKSGISPDKLPALAAICEGLPNLRLRGLMALPALYDNIDQQRKPFQQLRQLHEKLHNSYPCLDALSMGTSHDMEAAIAEGATMVRIGTAIFGPREH